MPPHGTSPPGLRRSQPSVHPQEHPLSSVGSLPLAVGEIRSLVVANLGTVRLVEPHPLKCGVQDFYTFQILFTSRMSSASRAEKSTRSEISKKTTLAILLTMSC